MRKFVRFTTYREVAAHASALVAADEARRYIIDEDVRIPTPDGATVSAIVVRRGASRESSPPRSYSPSTRPAA